MISRLKKFCIFGLWGEKQVELSFAGNKLLLVGENGSGKTTILRMVYETLACKWAMLSLEEFDYIELHFENADTVKIEKKKLKIAKELFVAPDSALMRELPAPIRRSVIERADISGREISCDQILEVIDEYGYPDRELTNSLKEKMEAVESKALSQYSNAIRNYLNCKIIYLPTYRRVEKRIGYVNEKEYIRRHMFAPYRSKSRGLWEEQAIEIAKTGMDDVEYFIQMTIDDIKRKADISASRLNYQCFSGILKKTSDTVNYDPSLLSDEEIQNVFGSINSDVLSPEDSIQIKEQLSHMKGMDAPAHQTYEQIVYYFYSMLHERYLQLKENEKIILSFFDACNDYLVNKEFVYDAKQYKYEIRITDGSEAKTIDLEHLSSGEKQVVSVFSYLYLSKPEQFLILIDEPELSLSVPWQKKFVVDIAKGNQCAGVVAVTHSPFIFDNNLRPFAHALEEFIK